MNGLDLDNILSPEEVNNLFPEIENTSSEDLDVDTKEKQNTDNETIEESVNIEQLFDVNPESVDSGESEADDKIISQEDTTLERGGSSPNFYSSIAKAFKEDGIFPDLNDDTIKGITSPEEFSNVINDVIKQRFDERQQRIDQALSANVSTNDIKYYENILSYLDNIKEEDLKVETEEGEKLREQLLYQDYLNRGFTPEKAEREVKKSFDSGVDIQDAVDALKGNKTFFKDQYNNIIKEAESNQEQIQKDIQNFAKELENSIIKDDGILKELAVPNNIRQNIYNNISKPTYKDPETGQYLTEIQKYEKNNRKEFLKNVSLFYTLTDGFTNFEKLFTPKVRKEVNKGIKELEKTLNSTSRMPDGSLRIANSSTDAEATINWKLDV